MRGWTAGIGVCAILTATTAVAATKLMPPEIQSTFFTGEPFSATTPSGVKFKMTFTTDGKAKRVPSGKGGQRSRSKSSRSRRIVGAAVDPARQSLKPARPDIVDGKIS